MTTVGLWADEEDIFDIVRREASPEAVALANLMIELFSGALTTSGEAGIISARNLRLLMQATAFQAVWLDAHPDVLEAMDVEGVSQDGLNATYASANAHLLAPLANRCLNRLSWKKAPLRVRHNRRGRAAVDHGNRDNAVRDDQYVWTPMHGYRSTP